MCQFLDIIAGKVPARGIDGQEIIYEKLHGVRKKHAENPELKDRGKAQGGEKRKRGLQGSVFSDNPGETDDAGKYSDGRQRIAAGGRQEAGAPETRLVRTGFVTQNQEEAGKA